MPVIYQSRIYRADLQANRNVLYVFGDNVRRAGYGGQAKEMRGEKNAVGVATKWFPAMKPEAFFSDAKHDEQRAIIASDLAPVISALKAGRIIVWPMDDIGTGLSDLPNQAPVTWNWLLWFREEHNIK